MKRARSWRLGLAMAACLVQGLSAAEEQTPAAGTEASPAPVFTLPAMPSAPAAITNPPGTILVRINDKTVTQADVNAELDDLKRMMETRGGRSADQLAMMLPTITPQILDSLVVRTLLQAEFDRRQLTVSDADIAAEIDRIKATLPKDKTLEDVLKVNGVSDKTFREDVAEQIKLGKLLAVPEPTADDVKAYYTEHEARFSKPESVRARHILIAVQATNSAAEKAVKKAKAETLRQQVVDSKGAEFETLARANSDCPSKARGGDLGEFRKGQMVAAFEKAAFALQTNEISPVVETDFGYHVIQALEHQEARTVPLEEVRQQIALQIRGRRLQEQAAPFIKGLREKAKIEYLNGAEPIKPLGDFGEPEVDADSGTAPKTPPAARDAAPAPAGQPDAGKDAVQESKPVSESAPAAPKGQ